MPPRKEVVIVFSHLACVFLFTPAKLLQIQRYFQKEHYASYYIKSISVYLSPIVYLRECVCMCSQFSKNKLLVLSVGALGAGFIYVFHSSLYS